MSPELKSAGLGVLVVMAGWFGWSMLHPDELPTADEAHLPAGPVAQALPPAPDARRIAIAPVALAAQPASATNAAPLADTPVLKDGFVLEHGQVTAVRAPLGAGQSPPAAVSNAPLPPGVSPDDAVVSPAGMVTLLRAPAPTAGTPVDAATADAPRPQALSRSN